MWIIHTIPFHYVWDAGLALNEHFRIYDPAQLGAYNESTHEEYDSNTFPSEDVLHSGTVTYDTWMQGQRPLIENTPTVRFERGVKYYSPNVRFFIEDFEGWHKRPLTGLSSGETALLSSLYYFEDIQGEGSPY